MKPYIKKSIFGERECWIEKINPIREAFISNSDLRRIDTLPETHTLKAQSGLQGILLVIGFVLVLYSGYTFEPLIETKTDHNYFIILLTIVFTIVGILFLLNSYFANKYKSSSPSLVLTFDSISYNQYSIAWSDIKGIYTIHKPTKYSGNLNGIRIKTTDNKIINISVHYYKIDKESVPKLISSYKTRWDVGCQKTTGNKG